MSYDDAYRIVKVAASALLLCLAILPLLSYADPTGASITYNSTGSSPIQPADSKADPRGTITTMVLNAIQQDQHWKGYVGNVTGVLTLDDSNGNTIYDWDLTGLTISGEVYVTRTSSPNWTSVQCADNTRITSEETFHNMTSSEADSITSTFNYTLHSGFYVGTNSVSADSCPSTATYIDDNPQSMSNASSTKFQEILLMDGSYNVLFTTIIEDNADGFTVGTETFDFQLIVPESDVKSTPTTYYFYTEIGS